jgi:hypothetical protein
MRSFAAKLLIAVLILSQTWMGAVRGIELCIPTGPCESCEASPGCEASHASSQTSTHVHEALGRDDCAHHAMHQHGNGVRHRHANPHLAFSRITPNSTPHAAVADEDSIVDCTCHVHVTAPDDDAERRALSQPTVPTFPLVARRIESWIAAAKRPTEEAPPARPPNCHGAPRFERVLIAATELLV